MQKFGLFIALSIWILVSVHYFTGQKIIKENVVDAFSDTSVSEITGEINAYGEYGITHLTDDEKRTLLIRLAAALGVDSNYSITDEETAKVLIRYFDDVMLIIKVITVTDSSDIIIQDRQYISISLSIKNNNDCIMTYKNMISDLFEADGIDGRVCLNLVGRISGTLNYDERGEYSDKLLKLLNAEIVTQSRGSDIYTIYAYTEQIDDYIMSGNDKININISMSYDENTKETIIYLATPLNNLDY